MVGVASAVVGTLIHATVQRCTRLLSVGTDTKTLNLFGVAAISGIAGMFTREATEKLQDVADTIFKPRRASGPKDDPKDNSGPGHDSSEVSPN